MTVDRNAAFFENNIDNAKGFFKLLKLQESAKFIGFKDVPKWRKAVDRAFYENVKRHAWIALYVRLNDGKPLPLRIQNITPEPVASFDWTP